MSSFTSSEPSTSSPTGSVANNAAPVTQPNGSTLARPQIITISVIVGLVVVSIVVFLLIACRKRDVKLKRLRFKRSATPLADSEFDRWRKPTKDPALYHSGGSTIYKSSGLRYDGLKAPAPMVQAFMVPSIRSPTTKTRPTTPPQPTQTSPLLEKSPAASSRPLIRSTSVPSVQGRHTRHKSSVSIHDRPPTPYSPTTPPSAWDHETLWHEEAPTSPREQKHRVHLSDTSDFDFGFGYGPPDSPRREPVRRESWVHHSRRFSSIGTVAHPNYQNFQFDLEAGQRPDHC